MSDDPDYTAPPAKVVRTMKCVDAAEYEAMQAEIDSLRKQRDAMVSFVRGVADDVNALSTRPRDAIGFGDLVNTIQTWGDNANEILKEYSESA